MKQDNELAGILMQALPYIRSFSGKTLVIKHGGHAMTDPDLTRNVIRDAVLMHSVGMNPIIVHGGGPEVNAAMEKVGKKPQFVNGLRVTDPETMEIVEMVLSGKTNKGIVSTINTLGAKGVGLSGKDANLIVADKATCDTDLGCVGEVKRINEGILMDLLRLDYIPVISSVAIGSSGESLNVNADHVAGEIAVAVNASKLIMVTDVPGIYRDFEDKSSLISELKIEDAKGMIARGEISKGMIPKVEACITALHGGVDRAHIIDGTSPHSLLMEVFTDSGVGTMVVQ